MSASEVLGSTENISKILKNTTLNLHDAKDLSFKNAPKWLTHSYLEKCLKFHYKDNNLRITKMHACPALSKGENYGGVLTRITADFQLSNNKTQQTGHYILKTAYEGDEFANKMMEPYDIFNREMHIYEEVLPKLKSLLHEINDDEQIFADTLAVDRQRSALIFEDLKVRNFSMPDRIKGINMDLAKIVLRKLAKMHAASAVLNERENGCLEIYDRGMFNRHTDNYAPCFVGLLEACSRFLMKCPDYEYYGKKLQTLKPMYMELAKRVFDVNKGHFNVFAHGDLWTNNIMVKYDDQTAQPLDAIILDFQYSAWGSPAIDLHYFFSGSLEEDMHLYRQDELIYFYYWNLADTLRKLHYKAPIPSLHNFHIQLEEKAFYAFSSTCFVQPVQVGTETEDADFNALMMEDERAINFKNTIYKNPYVQRIIKYLLPIYERRGLLDIDQ